MRILNVGTFNWITPRSRHSVELGRFDIHQKLTYAATRAGHLVVEFADRAIAKREAPLGIRALGQKAVDRRFLQMCDEFRPDIIFLHFADLVSNEAVTAARKLAPGVRIADVNIDPVGPEKNERRLSMRRDVADAVFVTTAGDPIKRFGGARSFSAFMPNPVDRSVETGRGWERSDQSIDLLLPLGNDGPRAIGDDVAAPSQALAAVRETAPALKIHTPGLGAPRVGGVRYLDMLNDAKMGWALSRHNDQPFYASDRMAHMTGFGLLTFLDRKAGFSAIYAEEEIAFYGNLEEFVAKARGFAADDALRRETAKRGWEKTWAVFESGRVLGYLLAQLHDQDVSAYEWPVDRHRA